MDFKTGVRVGLFSFLCIITVQTHAAYCSGKATCSLLHPSNLHRYLDVGFGQIIHSNLSSASHKVNTDDGYIGVVFSQQKKFWEIIYF